MIRVTVELISAISKSRNRHLGVAEIRNLGTGSKTQGNYEIRLSKAGGHIDKTWRHGEIFGFPRQRLGGWDLLFRCLRSCVGERNVDPQFPDEENGRKFSIPQKEGEPLDIIFRTERYARAYVDCLYDHELITLEVWDRLIAEIVEHWPYSETAQVHRKDPLA